MWVTSKHAKNRFAQINYDRCFGNNGLGGSSQVTEKESGYIGRIAYSGQLQKARGDITTHDIAFNGLDRQTVRAIIRNLGFSPRSSAFWRDINKMAAAPSVSMSTYILASQTVKTNTTLTNLSPFLLKKIFEKEFRFYPPWYFVFCFCQHPYRKFKPKIWFFLNWLHWPMAEEPFSSSRSYFSLVLAKTIPIKKA